MRKLQKPISIFLIVLMLIGTFLLTGFSAYASSDTDILTVDNFWIVGDILHVTVSDKNTGVTYEIELNLRDHINESDEYITLQATDNEGNISNSIKFKNPFFSPDAVSQSNTTPPPVQTNPFTPDGTGSIVDNATEEDGKEFFSITTENGNIFYLIVDRQRNSDNIYLLNAVTERDLLPFIETHDNSFNITPTPPKVTEPEPETEPTPVPESTPEPDANNNGGTILLIVIIAAVVGGVAYYIKVIKPKKEAFDDDFGDEGFENDTENSEDDIDYNNDDEENDPNV